MGEGVHPSGLALIWHLEHGVRDGKVMVGAQDKEPQSILRLLSHENYSDGNKWYQAVIS